MTFMPNFIQSSVEFSHQYHMNLETELLRESSRANLSHLLSKPQLAAPAAVYKARLEAELQILADKNYSGYFLIVADYVQWAKDNGIAVGPGRGAGPSSLLGFVLGITTIDPIKHGLPFERFVNPIKQSLPDFDLDFCAERCGEVVNYIQTKYGATQVAQISSDDGIPLPSRLVICDRPVSELVPVYSNPASGIPAAQMTIPQIAAAGLVQFNVISQNVLTSNQHALQVLSNSGTAIDIDRIDLTNSDAYKLLSTGELLNITVFDRKQYKTALINIQPDCLDHLSAAVALCYHGLHDRLIQYAERRHNPALVNYPHPAIEHITAETYGLILYQEQVMQIVYEIAGISLADGDIFRRELRNSTSDANAADTSEYKSRFINGAINYGLSQTEATDLFGYVALAGKGSFNKSHAVAYAKLAYQEAWLKTRTGEFPTN